LLTPDGVLGVIETGARFGSGEGSGRDFLLRETLAGLPEEPGSWSAILGITTPTCGRRVRACSISRDEERRLLTSPELRQFLDEQKIRVIGYAEFCA